MMVNDGGGVCYGSEFFCMIGELVWSVSEPWVNILREGCVN